MAINPKGDEIAIQYHPCGYKIGKFEVNANTADHDWNARFLHGIYNPTDNSFTGVVVSDERGGG